jgi:hypothetical protein
MAWTFYNSSGEALVQHAESEATQAQMEAETASPIFVPPDLVKNSPGVAKAWVHYDHKASSTLAEYNIDSVTDSAAGLFTVVFDVDFSSANYAIAGINREDGATNEATGLSIQYNYAPAAGSVPLLSFRIDGTRIDSPDIGVTFHGDQ